MSHSTLERPSFAPKTENIPRLDLNRVKVIEQLPEWSPFELRTLAPTPERPVAVYLATPKEEDEDTMRGSLIAIKESANTTNSMEVFWQADPDSMCVVRASAGRDVEQMGVGDDASVAGTFEMRQSDKLFFITNQRLDALKQSGQFTADGIDAVLGNENERQEIIEITLDGMMAAPLGTSASAPVSNHKAQKDVEELKLMRKNKKKNNDRKRARSENVSTSGDEESPSATTAINAPTVTPLVFAQSKRTTLHSVDATTHPPVAVSREMDDEERQQEIDTKRGFAVIDKRARSRDELLNTPLEELVAGIDMNKITDQHQAEQLASIRESFADTKAADGQKQPVSQESTSSNNEEVPLVPSTEGHEPLLHGPMNRVTVTTHYNIPPKPDHAPTVQDSTDERDKVSVTNLLGKMHAYFSTKYFMRQNNRQPRNPEKEKRLKKIALITTMGAVGFVAWKLNPEWQNSFGGALDTIVPGATDTINETFPGTIHTDEVSQRSVAEDMSTSNSDVIDQRTIDQRAEVLASPAHIIPFAGGGEAYAAANGADPAIWRQNQAEFLQQFSDEAYMMSDGNVGFRKPGELSDAAKEYWAKKFGQWR